MAPTTARPRPPLFRALGAADPPAVVFINGERYHRLEIYKHDSWAATAVYSGGGQMVVCKFNRVQPILGMPMASLGKRLADRERRALERLAGIPEIPAPLGSVYADGRRVLNAVARVYIPGHPLGKNDRPSSRFFPALREAIREMHARGIAYVDLHKRENIIVGKDGKPYLVDFQISFDVEHPRVRWIPGIRTVFDWLCLGDFYHFDKHVHRIAPAGAVALRPMIPTWLRLHRLVAVPFRQFRRRLLVAVGIRKGQGSVATEYFAEDAVRREVEAKAA